MMVVGMAVWVVVGRGVAVAVGGTAVSVTRTTSIGTGVFSTLLQASNRKTNESVSHCFFIMAQL
jgi:hypothetical protein